MAADASIKISMTLTGLGNEIDVAEKFSVTATPTASTYNYRVQASADSDEGLDLGDVSTVEMVWIKAISKDLHIDCDYSAAFDGDLLVEEGEVALFKPVGTIKVKNATAGETCTYEYLLCGST